MNPLHDEIARLLSERLKKRSVVVWYDPRSEFTEFVEELRGKPLEGGDPAEVVADGTSATLIGFGGSMFQLRAAAEPLVSLDEPQRVVVYLPEGERDEAGSILMELEKAGTTWEPQLKRVARNVLRKRFTDGVIDDLLGAPSVTYADLARATTDEGTGEAPSLLKTVFHDINGTDAILATWLANDDRDSQISAKGAQRELAKLLAARAGIELSEGEPLEKWRSVSLRHILGGEFRSDLIGEVPAPLDSVPAPGSTSDEKAIHELAQRLRSTYPDQYEEIADRIEGWLGLASVPLPPDALGSIDTFRFEERVVLGHCAHLIVDGRFDDALAFIVQREQNFWLDRDVARRAQWEACRRMVDLGKVAAEVRAELASAHLSAPEWVDHYASARGWCRLDQAQRRLEMFVAKLDEDPPERALASVRLAYEDACQAMAVGFTKAFIEAGWSVPGVLHQTQVHSEVVAQTRQPVAYFFVDALRYEMGLDLAERLPGSSEVRVRPAIAALPSITPIGMGALEPGASASFDVVEEGGKLGARIDGTFLRDVPGRRKFAEARIPGLVDMTLGDVLTWSKSKLATKVAGAPVVVVRSQEIDFAGETGFAHQARQVMDSVIDDLARAVLRLADAGVPQAVLSADHGHLFAHGDRDDSMRVDSPGGAKVELHRRCWIGRGGATPPGCIRVSAADLGYESDLDFVFPPGSAVFKAGGDLGYHHGGPTLQELVIPVVTVRSTSRTGPPPSTREQVLVHNAPEAITNRIFSVTVEAGGSNLALFSSPRPLQPVLVSGATQVGVAALAVDAEFDRATGTVTVQPGKPATVGFLLSDDTASSLRIVIRDPSTDLELYRSPADIPVRLGVG